VLPVYNPLDPDPGRFFIRIPNHRAGTLFCELIRAGTLFCELIFNFLQNPFVNSSDIYLEFTGMLLNLLLETVNSKK
jgi:hypothetical protein